MEMGGEVSRFSACMIKLIWNSTQIVQLLQSLLFPCRYHVLIFPRPIAPLPATKSLFLLMTNQNQTSPVPLPQNQLPDSRSVQESQQQQLGYRCIAVTAVHAMCVFVWSVLRFPVERSGTIVLSHRPKIFVTAAIPISWAKIMPRRHIFGHLKIFKEFSVIIF